MIFYSIRAEHQRCVTDYPDVGQSFLNGRLLDISAIETPVRVHGLFRSDAPPSHFEPGLIPVFSTHLVETLERVGVDNLQHVPAVIVGNDGAEWSDYRAVQVVGIVRCCNLETTEHEIVSPGIDNAPPLIVADEVDIDPSRVPADLKFFRLAEQPSHLIASEVVVDALVEQIPEEGWGIIAEQASPDEDDD